MAAASSGSSGSAVTLADLSGVAEHSRSLAKLTDELAELLRQQASVSREVNKLLTDPSDGLNESSRRTMRSLDVAIAKARQPGYFRYYAATGAAAEVESKHVLSLKVELVKDLQGRIDAKNAEIERVRAEAAKPPPVPEVPDLKRWFDRYQRPDPTFGGDGARSSVTASSRVFGGTKHYPAFRSVATDMRVGRALR